MRYAIRRGGCAIVDFGEIVLLSRRDPSLGLSTEEDVNNIVKRTAAAHIKNENEPPPRRSNPALICFVFRAISDDESHDLHLLRTSKGLHLVFHHPFVVHGRVSARSHGA
jgi:hypothetical protein